MSSSKWAVVEALTVFAMILVYIWRLRFVHPLSWIVIFMLIVASHVFRKESPARLGFGTKNLRSSAAALTPFVVVLALALLSLGLVFRTIRHITPESGYASLLMYCGWGLFQQYILNGYFVNRLRAPLPAAVLFSAAHTPNWFLMLVTLAGGYLCAKAYLRFGNLYFLGLAHGVIGFLIYLVVPDTISHHLYVGPKWFL
jgi:hypothetical protein